MHKKLESWMGRVGGFIHDNPFKVIALVVMLLAFPLSQVPNIKMDTSTEGFMHEDDPVLLKYNDFRAQFGRDERIAVVLKNDNIFTLDFLGTLKNIHEEIETKVPFINDINSLYNIRNTRGEGDTLITDDLLEPFPTTKEQVASIKQRAMA
ncbi:MAG: RND transporter, partial [Campylobacterota bacterium]